MQTQTQRKFCETLDPTLKPKGGTFWKYVIKVYKYSVYWSWLTVCLKNVMNPQPYVFLCVLFSHQGHLRRLQPWLWCFLRLHWPVEQPLPHPGGFIQCQPADETLQTVKSHNGTDGRHLLRRQTPARLEIDVTVHGDLSSLITAEAFVYASCLEKWSLIYPYTYAPYLLHYLVSILLECLGKNRNKTNQNKTKPSLVWVKHEWWLRASVDFHSSPDQQRKSLRCSSPLRLSATRWKAQSKVSPFKVTECFPMVARLLVQHRGAKTSQQSFVTGNLALTGASQHVYISITGSLGEK